MSTNDLLNTKVTIFPNITSPKQPHHVSISAILKRIKEGKSRELIEKIRPLQDKKERDAIKMQLPSICFSGMFQTRNNKDIMEHSGFICVDFDHVKDLGALKAEMRGNKYVFAYFTSPSGDGLKILIRIPKDISGHPDYAHNISKYLNKEDLDEFKDVARVCYESYDPELYINLNAVVFDIATKEKPVIMESDVQGEKLKEPFEIYKRIKTWAEKSNSYHDGNKHNFLVFIACACNRYGLGLEFTAQKLIGDYQNAASFVDSNDFYDIVKRVYITYEGQHSISFFTTEGENVDYDPEGKARDVIYLNDIREEMLSSFYKGDAEGETTYFQAIDRHWRWKKGELTLMHGIPNHGKSIMMLQLMLIKSIKEGTKWGVFSPEQNPPIDFYKDLIHMYIGKSTEIGHKNRMSDKEYIKGMDFLNSHFFFVYPKDESPTPQYINDRFEELIIKEGIEGCLTDPFNQLDNDWKKFRGRDDHYISSYLTKEKRFSLTHDVYKLIVAHPRGSIDVLTDKSQDPDLKNAGNYRCPNSYDLAGGAMWYNKCDNILVTYQPYYMSRVNTSHNETPDVERHPNMVQFKSQKIKKPKLNGMPGTANLIFNLKEFRYYEEDREELNGDMQTKKKEMCPFYDEYGKKVAVSKRQEEINDEQWDAIVQNASEKKKEKEQRLKKENQDRINKELGLNNEGEKEVVIEPYSSPSVDDEPFGGFEVSDDDMPF